MICPHRRWGSMVMGCDRLTVVRAVDRALEFVCVREITAQLPVPDQVAIAGGDGLAEAWSRWRAGLYGIDGNQSGELTEQCRLLRGRVDEVQRTHPDAVDRTRCVLEATDQPGLELQIRVGERRHPGRQGFQRRDGGQADKPHRQGGAVPSPALRKGKQFQRAGDCHDSPSLTDSLPQRRRAGRRPPRRRTLRAGAPARIGCESPTSPR